ncbi:hypothetical protein AB4140_07780 [Shewanella sp. 10N.286.51.B2]|uniref:hypothetical protein n=1 Tax=Shewanella sp. 10N.286.51.B2 TaxID=3229707 RepID=UPI00354F6D89
MKKLFHYIALFICPVIIISGCYNFGYILALEIYSGNYELSFNTQPLGLIAAALCSIRPFIQAVKKQFKVTSNQQVRC